eukprot:1158884-Pelagomonas_calceolata.AAC.7
MLAVSASCIGSPSCAWSQSGNSTGDFKSEAGEALPNTLVLDSGSCDSCVLQGGGMMDASVLLKPLLGRGELRCIGEWACGLWGMLMMETEA